ncbi:hypothetical protein Slala02_28040 [Streptomyces lavendulae subsp. lavendulae]|nr:hypothetical protein Slala01_31330 [Streptomyces lavendulae subsp. lavendulae]GLX26984.1 hypothetical protein Slala02_28040 [Streptomyces lavendulae subsp. lavendulae]
MVGRSMLPEEIHDAGPALNHTHTPLPSLRGFARPLNGLTYCSSNASLHGATPKKLHRQLLWRVLTSTFRGASLAFDQAKPRSVKRGKLATGQGRPDHGTGDFSLASQTT